MEFPLGVTTFLFRGVRKALSAKKRAKSEERHKTGLEIAQLTGHKVRVVDLIVGPSSITAKKKITS